MSRSPINRLKDNEGIAALVFLIAWLVLAYIVKPGVGTSGSAPAVAQAAAPWIFGPFQVLLLYLPPWLGVLVLPVLLLLGLAGLPWLAEGLGEKWGRGIFSTLFGVVVILLVWYGVTEFW